MSRLSSLLRQVGQTDPHLAADLAREVEALSQRRQFGLNFERHTPETVELCGRPIRKGDKVRFLAPRGEPTTSVDRGLWKVKSIRRDDGAAVARLVPAEQAEAAAELVERAVEDLVVVAEFRDPIYPGLVSTGKVERGGDSPFHTVINAENFHAVQALLYTHEGKVDAIYIDPPYNNREKSWKYNNDYVDTDDAYRHSKWLAFMERRLRLARRLLNPERSVLVVTIDENEYLRLGLLLEQTFPEANLQMVSSVVNRKGVPRKSEFSRVDEYIFFVMLGDAGPALAFSDMLSVSTPSATDRQEVGWIGLRRRGSEWRRRDRPGSFYPIYVNPESGQIEGFGEALDPDADRSTIADRPDLLTVWPLNSKGEESRWQLAPSTAADLLEAGYLRTSFQKGRRGLTLEYLSDGQRRQIEEMTIEVEGRDANGAVLAVHVGGRLQQAKTVWNQDSHGATAYGTQMLTALLPGRRFPYPKSLYAVEDALRFFVGDNPDATIIDFFSGSGTTAHAVMRLNRQDGGRRCAICVTNNEVSPEEQRALREQGLRPGDPEWEALGICEHVTKPRITAAVTGRTPGGVPVSGGYKFRDVFPIAEGFAENVEFFTMTYEAPRAVAHHRSFEAVAPLLWLKAGARGRRIEKPTDDFAVADAYAILFDTDFSREFLAALHEAEIVRMVFVVTDDDRAFQMVCAELPASIETVRLYSSYLTNFTINTGRE